MNERENETKSSLLVCMNAGISHKVDACTSQKLYVNIINC